MISWYYNYLNLTNEHVCTWFVPAAAGAEVLPVGAAVTVAPVELPGSVWESVNYMLHVQYYTVIIEFTGPVGRNNNFNRF